MERGGKPALRVNGSDVVLLLATDPKQSTPYEELQERGRSGGSATVEVTGAIETRQGQPDVLVVRTVRTAGL